MSVRWTKLFSLLVLAFVSTHASAQLRPAWGIDNFLRSVGANTDLSYTDTPYTQTQNVLAALRYLGISTIRDTIPTASNPDIPAYDTLAAAGIKFDSVIPGDGLVQLSSDLAALDAFEQAYPGSIAAIENPNEINAWPITYDGITNTYAAGVTVAQALWTDVRAEQLLDNVPIYAPTLAVDTSGEAELGDLSPYVTYGNAHVYASRGENVWIRDMPYWLPVQARPTPGKPMVVTETGYSMIGVDVNPSEEVAAKYTLNTLFDDALHGIVMTYIYQLVDEPPAAGVIGSGLFNSNWTPKPAAVALHNLTAILRADAGGSATTAVDYSIVGLPVTAHQMVLTSATGSDIAIWNDVTIWNSVTNEKITVPPSRVVVSLMARYAQVEVYDPVVGTLPIETHRNIDQFTLAITDHPVIVKLGGLATTPATTSGLGK